MRRTGFQLYMKLRVMYNGCKNSVCLELNLKVLKVLSFVHLVPQGGNPSSLKGLDGVSLWSTLTKGSESPRTSMLYNIDNPYNNSAIRDRSWKLIQGTNDHRLNYLKL